MCRVAVIGAGPIGLEATLAALDRGYEVALYERGRVAECVSQWGHVRMFSPFAMNASKFGRNKLQALGVTLPGPDELLTGREFRESYLVPMARSLPKEVLYECCDVLALGRSRALKGDHIGEATRSNQPFRLLLKENGKERIAHADVVLDCSGTFGQPNRLGDGGIPAPGEEAAADRIFYGIPDSVVSYSDRCVLVVGSGHSAATVIGRLSSANVRELHWLLRKDREQPVGQLSDDPLPERARLAATVNQLVRERRVTLHRGCTIEQVERVGHGLEVTISGLTDTRKLAVDFVVVATGFRPDMNLARELQVQTCWATEGTYPLAASLLGEAGADCLTTPAFGADMLMHPEPNYFTLGMKSYGRSPNFLLRTGHEQIATVLDSLGSAKV